MGLNTQQHHLESVKVELIMEVCFVIESLIFVVTIMFKKAKQTKKVFQIGSKLKRVTCNCENEGAYWEHDFPCFSL